MTPAHVLVVEDDADFRWLLTALLNTDPDVCVAGEAEDGETAVTLALQDAPSIVLMDLMMPRVDGLEATRRIKQAAPAAQPLSVAAIVEGFRNIEVASVSDAIEQLFLIEAATGGKLFTDEQQKLLSQFMRHTDYVKFAQYVPTLPEMERCFAFVLQLIPVHHPPRDVDLSAVNRKLDGVFQETGKDLLERFPVTSKVRQQGQVGNDNVICGHEENVPDRRVGSLVRPAHNDCVAVPARAADHQARASNVQHRHVQQVSAVRQ